MANQKVTKRAKVLDKEDVKDALEWCIKHSSTALRDQLMILLTVKLGLRAQEVAMLYVEDVSDARGRLQDSLFVSRRGAKGGKARTLPMHPEVKAALKAFMDHYKSLTSGPLFFNQYGDRMSPDAVRKQLTRIYEGIGLRGCSSHSGRRTFGTTTARNITKMGGSLKDVMHLMGHSSISTTEIYVDYTERAAELVNMM